MAAKFESWAEAVAARADALEMSAYIVGTINMMTDGQEIDLDFLDRDAVGQFCRALGFSTRRNWGALTLDEIAPPDRTGANVVPPREARRVLEALRALIEKSLIVPLDEAGKPKRELLNDFLPRGGFAGHDTLGHLWEFQYALAVELEHGVTRGSNVTNNHPMLTALVVLAHLSEDRLYYARLWVMESEGEVFAAELEKKPYAQLQDSLTLLGRARTRLAQRIEEKLAG